MLMQTTPDLEELHLLHGNQFHHHLLHFKMPHLQPLHLWLLNSKLMLEKPHLLLLVLHHPSSQQMLSDLLHGSLTTRMIMRQTKMKV
jgi:hypothetical protein